MARERTKHSNCSLPLQAPGAGGGRAGVLEFVWCKRVEDVTAAAQEMLDMLRHARGEGGRGGSEGSRENRRGGERARERVGEGAREGMREVKGGCS